MKYYIIAGEASGDLHGSNLMKGLYAQDSNADIRFWGGKLMNDVYSKNQEGKGLVQDYNDGAVIGFSGVIFGIKKFIKRLKFCKADIKKFNPNVVILIDYPGFNFKIAKFAHNQGFKVFYYIAPKVWASREGRVKQLKAYVDKLFIVFPFEKDYFKAKGIDYIYKGNPLVDAIDNSTIAKVSKEDFFKLNNLLPCDYIALLAGSRNYELKTMLPVLVAFAEQFRKIKGYEHFKFIIAGAPSQNIDKYLAYISAEQQQYIKVIFGQTYTIIKHSRAAVVNSGTASLETCLLRCPQVVGYKTANFNFIIARQIIKINYISLGNLILNKKVFKELIQNYLSVDNLVAEVMRLVGDEEYRHNMLLDYDKIRALLGGGGASVGVARAMIEQLNNK